MQRLLRILASPWTFRLWVVFIVFSQSGLAGRLADQLVLWLFGPSPDEGDELLRQIMQKGYHVMLFSGLGALLGWSTTRRSHLEILAWCVGFSAASEALQMLSAGRHPAWSDALLNVVSALLGWRIVKKVFPSSDNTGD